MTFGIRDVERCWGQNGIEIIEELYRYHGAERLPDPVIGDTLPDYLTRLSRAGLCHVAGDMHLLQDVQAMKRAENRGLPIYDVNDIEPEFRGEQYRDLPISERFAAYTRDKNTLPGTVVPEVFEEE
jgi:hypothetical protein